MVISSLIRLSVLVTLLTAGLADAEDPCYKYVDTETLLYANCIPMISCTSGNIIANACPSYPTNYACCFQDNFPGREFRAAWIATVDNIDWPKSATSSVETQQQEIRFLIDQLHSANINAIYFQVRPAGDALYVSSIEPWSIFLTGEQGKAPNPLWDPLEYVITYCRSLNIEVHAWINPYRANLKSNSIGLAPNHMAILYPEYAYKYSTFLWMDPGATIVQNRTYDVVIDLVTRYDLDGIHMDDYFYPYPVAGEEFPDNLTYNAYLQSGGNMSLDDWRRDNVNQLIKRLNIGVHNVKRYIRFSISPFGIYRPGHPEGMPPPIVGLDQYSEIYCDAKLWLQQGWVDALQPQLYWRIDPPQQSYPILLNWWVEQNIAGRHIYAGNYLSRVDIQDWPLEEIKNQTEISRQTNNRLKGSWGNVMFSATMFRDNIKDTVGFFNTSVYPFPALTPELPWLDLKKQILNKITDISVLKNRVHIKIPNLSNQSVNKLVIYEFLEQSGWQLFKVVSLLTVDSEIEFELLKGSYAVSVLNRFGREGEKTLFQV